MKDLLGSDRLVLWDLTSVAGGPPCSSGVLQEATCLCIHTGHLWNRIFCFTSNTQVIYWGEAVGGNCQPGKGRCLTLLFFFFFTLVKLALFLENMRYFYFPVFPHLETIVSNYSSFDSRWNRFGGEFSWVICLIFLHEFFLVWHPAVQVYWTDL